MFSLSHVFFSSFLVTCTIAVNILRSVIFSLEPCKRLLLNQYVLTDVKVIVVSKMSSVWTLTFIPSVETWLEFNRYQERTALGRPYGAYLLIDRPIKAKAWQVTYLHYLVRSLTFEWVILFIIAVVDFGEKWYWLIHTNYLSSKFNLLLDCSVVIYCI